MTTTDANSGPLAGIKVLEFGSALTAPWAAGILCDQGAEVVKIEPPGIGDVMRFIGSNRNGITTPFQVANRRKKSVVLDIKQEKGTAIALALIAEADVVIHNMRPGVMERRGLGYKDCHAINSDIIYCAISGYGHKGPMAQKPAYDNVIQAYSGLMQCTGTPDSAPNKIGPPVLDYGTGIQAAFAISAALFRPSLSRSPAASAASNKSRAR